MLGPDNPELVRGMGQVEQPQPVPRHWGIVSAGAVASLVAGAVLLPGADSTEKAMYNDCEDVWESIGRPLEEGGTELCAAFECGFGRHRL